MVETDVRYKDQTWWHVFPFQSFGAISAGYQFDDWCSAVCEPGVWLKRLKSKKCHEPANVAHLCGTQAGFLCDVSTEILMLLFAIPFISKANAICLPRLLGHFCFKAGHNSTLYIYIRIIKNLSLSPRRMLISHWSLESIWTPKTSKPCLKPEDKHVSLGVFASVNEWWQKVSL